RQFSHKIIFDKTNIDHRSVIRFFTNSILKESRLFSGFDILYPKVRDFIKYYIFGKEVDIESFSEFEKAYTYFKETEKYTEDIKTQIEKSHKDILFVEGDYDIKYLQKAAELLEKKEVLENFELFDGEGFGNLDKVYKHFNTKLAEIIPQKIVLLFDCDTNKEETNKGKIFKRVIPIISDNPIQKGIENMFKKPLIDKAMEYKSVFVDITLEHSKKIKGEEKIIPVLWEVNKDEKRNLCDWIINNANKEDFNNFNSIFDLLSEIINFKK
ncbi:MAG: hypothetical protein NTU73_05540, partial [Ignavibacteriae bacterium]|nr:hypothetical protein [Ignavibacteriota bacterium]